MAVTQFEDAAEIYFVIKIIVVATKLAETAGKEKTTFSHLRAVLVMPLTS